MQNKRKILTTLLLAGVLSAALTACGGKKEGGTEEIKSDTQKTESSVSASSASVQSNSVITETTTPDKSLVAEQLPESEQTEESSETEYYTTSTSIVNVRVKPNDTATVYGQLAPNTKLDVIEEKNGWYSIKLNGYTLYVKGAVVTTQKKTVNGSQANN